ncbi:MAG TPA: efflux transporter outer membrane subunit [Gemmatimonadaceae bacterium]|nr:efflux transporter outer membrane subunit [Gemmatimonadaceae bacterium]
MDARTARAARISPAAGRRLVPWLLLAAAACAVGPTYRPAPVVPERTPIVATAGADSSRAFFDSLARARTADSGRTTRPAARAVTMQSLADLAWLDILNDTALTSLVRTAVAQNRDVALAEARIREYRANADAVTGALFPRVTLNASASTNQAVFGASPPARYDALRMTGDVAWELDFWGRARRGQEAVAADLASQQAAERAAVLSLVSDVASGYLQLLELDQEQDVAKRTLASRQATLELARQRFAQGIVSELDVRQFEAQLAVPAARLAQVERLRAQQEHALNLLLGEGPAPVMRGGTLVSASRAVTVPDSLPASLIARRPDVIQADRAVAGAVARVGIAEAARLPAVSLSGFFGGQSPSGGQLFDPGSKVYQLQAGISFPLYTGGRLKNEEAAAQARADQAQAAYEKTALAAMREAGDALVGVRTSRDEVAANETQAGALRRAADLALLRYRSGISSYLEVLDAQRSLFDAELALSQARLRELTAAVQLYKALGGSWNQRP